MSENKENLQSVIHIAQTLLLRLKEKTVITPTLIAEKVAVAMLFDPGMAEGVDTQEAIAELVRRFSLWVGQDTTMRDDEGHDVWLNAGRKKDWRYWQRYRGWLDRKMSATAVDALDESTDRILGLLEDPNREGSWDRRGLVVGHVQSGKTGNYSGLICKAADAGYKLIIVLAGMHNNLRSQTQIRLEEGFLGYETSAIGDSGKIVGVGTIDSDAGIYPNCATNRSNAGDFNTKVSKHLAITPEQRPWLFVVKKNKTVLERLLKWIRGHVANSTDAQGHRYVSRLPLLLIDDESDHASVDTGEQVFNSDGMPDEEHQPKAINSRIRKILHAFSKAAYVGYTATPFANIFIHRRAATRDEGADLFPSSFIVNLSAPSNYIGPTRLFGVQTPDGRIGGLPLTRIVSDHAEADGLGGWMPAKHNKEHVPLHKGMDAIPPSLGEAVMAFVLGCAARVCRGQEREHASMLIHVTRFTAVQREVHRQVGEYLRSMKQRVSRCIDHEQVIADLKRIWEEDFEPTSTSIFDLNPDIRGTSKVPAWGEILAVIPETLGDIDVRMINGTAKDALDYAEREGIGLKIIAIGGDKLARGLTLEGLCVSYFVRTSKMYDTLMQMGRWFGYRPGYIDFCRLYTTEDLVEWFGHIADASEELREEFNAMAESGATPREYGMRVQSHPILMVTSPLKMRTAENLYLSFSGELLETVALFREPVILRRNLEATERLIAAIGGPSEIDPRRGRNGTEHIWKGFLWNEVPADAIVDFLSSYTTHPKARKVNSAVLADFVRSMVLAGELNSWTVALFGGGTGARYDFPGGLIVDAMLKRSADDGIKDRYSIGRVLSPKDEAIDLDATAWTAALDATRRAWKPDPARQRDSTPPQPPDLPNGPAIRRMRGFGAVGVPKSPERGLLLLYPLDPQLAGEGVIENWTKPVMAFGISFPSSESGTKIEYNVDHLLWEQEYGPAD